MSAYQQTRFDGVDLASGMVSIQAACTCDEAIVFMSDRAQVSDQVSDRSLWQLADAVLAQRIRFG